jgi:PKD repeat protein
MKRFKVFLFLLVIIGAMMVLTPTLSATDLPGSISSAVNVNRQEIIEREFEIQLYATNDFDSELDRILRQYNFELVRKLYRTGCYWVRNLDQRISDRDMIDWVSQDRAVAQIIQQGLAWHCAAPNDSFFAKDGKNMDRIGMKKVWDYFPNFKTGSQSVIVAVVDSGVLMTHEDYDSTTFTAGYDFINNDNNPTDDFQHGTHVAGTIAQYTNNAKGSSGVAYGVKIMPVKVLNNQGSGAWSVIADGIQWAADQGAHIINLSLGGSGGSTLCTAVNYAWNKGCLVVGAAGNDNVSTMFYPAACSNCIAVSSVEYIKNVKASYSNYGSWINIAGPGGELVDHDGDGRYDCPVQSSFAQGQPSNTSYYFMAGTSMACPHVSGVAAIVKSVKSSLTNVQIRDMLYNTAEDLGNVNYFGKGIVDAYAAYMAAAGTPNTPPTADFTFTISDLKATFTDKSTDTEGPITAWAWNFGDGSSSTAQNPIRTYAAGGTYTVTLTVTDQGGLTGSKTQSVTVTPPSGDQDTFVGSFPGMGIWKFKVGSAWVKLSAQEANMVAVGDMNGDGYDDFVGSFPTGVWFMNGVNGTWTRLHKEPAALLTTGDMDGDGKDDLIGKWNSIAGLWVRYAKDGSWEKISNAAVDAIAAGKL